MKYTIYDEMAPFTLEMWEYLSRRIAKGMIKAKDATDKDLNSMIESLEREIKEYEYQIRVRHDILYDYKTELEKRNNAKSIRP